MIGSPNSSSKPWPSRPSSTSGQKSTYRYGMPIVSATDGATNCDMAVATIMSHPAAASATVSYCAAMKSVTRWWRSSAVGGRSHERHGLLEGHQRHACAGQQLRELLVRRCAHPHLRPERLQLHRESHDRLDVPS